MESNKNNNPKLNLIQKMKSTQFIKTGNFTLKSGMSSNFYVDIKSLFSNPEIMEALSTEIYLIIDDLIKREQLNKNEIVICGLPYAGIPFTSYISLRYKIPMILLRKEQKKYGTKKMIEGSLNDKKHIILIDDILTTGISILESLEHLREYNIPTSGIVIIDREENGGKGAVFKRLNSIDSVFKLSEFTKTI